MRHLQVSTARISLLIALLIGIGASVLAAVPGAPLPTTSVQASGTGNWNQTGDPAVPREARTAMDLTAVALHAGRVLLIGGRGGQNGQATTILNEAELYNPASNQFTAAGVGTLVEARYGAAAVELANGNVLVSGGTSDGTNTKASAEIWNASSGTWSATGTMGTPRMGHMLYLLTNGNVVAIGGKTTISGNPLRSIEVYSTSANTWSAGPSAAQATSAMTQLSGGQVLRAYPNGTTEALNLDASAWDAKGNLTTPRTNPTLRALPGGRAAVLGGYNASGTTDGTKRIEVYDGFSTWTLGAPLYDSRADATAHFLPDGTLLIFGGKSGAMLDAHAVLTTETLDLDTFTANRVTPTLDDAISPTTLAMANADILSIGFREPGTNQTHHSLRYAAPAAQARLSVTPSPIAFGTVNVGSAFGGLMSVTATNIGGSPVMVGAVTMPGAGTVFMFGGCANTTVQPGQTCAIVIQFLPTAPIAYTTSLSIASNATGGTITIPAFGTGSTGISPTGVDFGAQTATQGNVVGAQEATEDRAIGPHAITGIPVIFTNIFSVGFLSSLTVNNVSIATGAGDFTIVSDQCTGHVVVFGTPCIVIVGFTPQGGGEKNGSVRFGLSTGAAPTVNVHGVGTNQNVPNAHFDVGSAIDFSNVNIDANGSYRKYVVVRVTNLGRAAFTHNATSQLTGPNTADFSLGQDYCTGGAIQPGQTCVLRFAFIPKSGSAGTRSAVFNFPYTDPQNNPYTSTVSLQGTAAASNVATKTLSIDSFNEVFATTAVGRTATDSLLVRNWGNTAITLSSVGLDATSVNDTDFLVGSECNNVTLQPGGQRNGYCQVTVTFRPTRAGSRTALFSVNAGAGVGGSTTAPLSGNATGQGKPALSSIAHGNQTATGSPQTLTTTQTQGTQPTLAIGTPLLSDVQTTNVLTITNVGTSLLGGGASVVSNDGGSLTSDSSNGFFSDNGSGFAAGSASLISQDGGGLVAQGGGNVVGPGGRVAPRTVSLHYVGDLTQSTCQSVHKLEPGESCTIAVRFAPVSNGTKPAVFSLPLSTANDTNSGSTIVAASVPLTGDGVTAPRITNVPSDGLPAAGGASLTIAGAGFGAGMKVYFGVPGGPNSITATSITATSLTLTTPPLAPGNYDVTAVTTDGRASNVGRYHAIPANFMPTLAPHATNPPVMGNNPMPLPTPHATLPPMSGAMPTPLPQPVRR